MFVLAQVERLLVLPNKSNPVVALAYTGTE